MGRVRGSRWEGMVVKGTELGWEKGEAEERLWLRWKRNARLKEG